MKIKNSNVAIARIIKSTLIPIGTVRGDIIEETPMIKNILKIFEPTIFPTEMSISFLSAAATDVTNSGSDVPAATIVEDMRNSLIPICLAIDTAPSTVNFPPITKKINPAISINEIFCAGVFLNIIR